MDDHNISYKKYGEGNHEVVLLHGWGQNIEMMDFLGQKLKNSKITIFDFPGFGKTPEPLYPMNVDDYADWLHLSLENLGIKNPILIGHSFGGRVSVKYASKYPTEKVVLLGTPIIRKRKKPTIKEKIYKVVKYTPIGDIVRKKIGSVDYNNATPMMREILVKVVNEDLLEAAKKIKSPTLLFAGIDDTAVSLQDTYEAANQMQDAAVIELNGTHYAYLENLEQISIIINEFISPSHIIKKM